MVARTRNIINLAAFITVAYLLWRYLGQSGSSSSYRLGHTSLATSIQRNNIFDQVFSVDKPGQYSFSALKKECDQTVWSEDNVFIQCDGISAGLASVMSEMKECFKMALDSGSGMILPKIIPRNQTQLSEWDKGNPVQFNEWFDKEHIINNVKRICPRMEILHPDQLTSERSVKNTWSLDMDRAEFEEYHGHFWRGRPFRAFFEKEYQEMKLGEFSAILNGAPVTEGISIVKVAPTVKAPLHFPYLIYRVTDDPTGHEKRLWNDLSHLFRFRDEPRRVLAQVLSQLSEPYYGVHFRVEKDSISSSLENQIAVDLDALDAAWSRYGSPASQKPTVYLACGDSEQVLKFKTAGEARGWRVTHKWDLVATLPETLQAIESLSFDLKGAVDFGVLLKSDFFIGIAGSAFSHSIAHLRDETGRYRGSSLDIKDDDAGARSHLFSDGENDNYQCCL